MSLIYKTVEGSCHLINTLTGNMIKTYMYSRFEKPKANNDLPKYIHRNFDINKVEYEDFPIFIIKKRNQMRYNGKVVLFLAGGGGMARPMGIHFDTAARLIKQTGATMYFAYYPLAPKYNVRDALEWLEGVYKAMQKRFLPENIVFIGDSAGANLVFSLVHRVAIKPGKVIAISPAVGLEDGRDRDIRRNMEKSDPILNVEMNDLIARHWSKKVPLDSPDINPKYINFVDFPEILMFYGSHELFYPHVKQLIYKIREDGAVIKDIEAPMCHDWALCSFFPEGRKAIRKMAETIC